jgi:hypothetical protein
MLGDEVLERKEGRTASEWEAAFSCSRSSRSCEECWFGSSWLDKRCSGFNGDGCPGERPGEEKPEVDILGESKCCC